MFSHEVPVVLTAVRGTHTVEGGRASPDREYEWASPSLLTEGDALLNEPHRPQHEGGQRVLG